MEPGGIDPGGIDPDPGGIEAGGIERGGIEGAEAGGTEGVAVCGGSGGIDAGIDAGGGSGGIERGVEPGGIDLGVGRGMLGGACAAGTGIERGDIGPRETGRGTDGADGGATGTGGGGLEGGSSRAIVPPQGYGLQRPTQTFPLANQASFEKSPIRSMHWAPYDRSSSRSGVRASFGSLTSVRVKMSSRRPAKPSACASAAVTAASVWSSFVLASTLATTSTIPASSSFSKASLPWRTGLLSFEMPESRFATVRACPSQALPSVTAL